MEIILAGITIQAPHFVPHFALRSNSGGHGNEPATLYCRIRAWMAILLE